ncbi:MAG: 23S rRNA (adenine(2503)-C(2))-methyltransferase RlmN [Thermodesulfobacteriota bacterium]
MSNLTDLRDFSRQQLVDWVASLGLPAFRAKQLLAWLHRPGIADFSQMTNLSKELRLQLQELAQLSEPEVAAREVSADGTRKYGLTLADGAVIESVLIPDDERLTLCVSSQVGCAMDCSFCCTATMGFKRNLTPSEITGQLRVVQADLGAENRIHNLVFMGMGEPLANLENLLTSLDILCDDLAYGYSPKRITISTCGLAPKLIELGRRAPAGLNLAISLHGASDAIREQLMPINKSYNIADLLAACQAYPLQKRQRITFEYILLADVNDGVAQARELARLLRGIPCKINLLPCNEAPEIPYKRPGRQQVLAFQNILKKAGYTVLIRSSRGADISAACGQLASQHQ